MAERERKPKTHLWLVYTWAYGTINNVGIFPTKEAAQSACPELTGTYKPKGSWHGIGLKKVRYFPHEEKPCPKIKPRPGS